MKRLVSNILILILLVTGVSAAAQSFSNRGKEFWVGYGHHWEMEDLPYPISPQEFVLYFSAEQPARVTVTIEGTGYSEPYDVPANSVIQSKILPRGTNGRPPSDYDARLWGYPSSYGGNSSEGLFTGKGIHIISDVPIVVYGHLYSAGSSGASMLMPVESWGYSYSILAPYQLTNYNLNSP